MMKLSLTTPAEPNLVQSTPLPMIEIRTRKNEENELTDHQMGALTGTDS